jgi:hypothetical protein
VFARTRPRHDEVVADAALVVLGHDHLLVLVTPVEEGELERQRLILKQVVFSAQSRPCAAT